MDGMDDGSTSCALSERGLSSEEVWRLIHPGARTVGPVKAVDELGLAAGLLFVRWNDRTSRTLVSRPGEQPHVIVTTHQFCSSTDVRVFLTGRVSDLLWSERWVEGDVYRWEGRLSAAGQRAVVERFECGSTDGFAAGAVLSLQHGKIRWPA